MKTKQLKFKVIALDWYYIFRKFGWRLPNDGNCTDEEVLECELARQQKDENGYRGPLRWLEVCEEQPFPTKTGIKYCIRLTNEEKKLMSKGNDWYWCYCYELGRWWKLKEPQYLFQDLFVPIYNYDTYYSIANSKAVRYLNPDAIQSYRYWDSFRQINGVRSRLSLYKFNLKTKHWKDLK